MHRKIPIPRGWNHHAKSAILHILALSHYTFTAMLARAANHRNRRTRLRAEIDRLRHEIALLQEELRIKDARMSRIPPHRPPHYTPFERMGKAGLEGQGRRHPPGGGAPSSVLSRRLSRVS